MTARSLGLLYGFRSPMIVGATLLLTYATTGTPGSQPPNGTRTGHANPGNDRTASGRSSVRGAARTTPGFAWPASVSADNRRFLDQKGNVYLLKTMSSWAMAQNCTNAEITNALEGLKTLGFRNSRDYNGGDYLTFSTNDVYSCSQRCMQEAKCLAFTFNTETKLCWLKNTYVQKIEDPHAIGGRK